MEMRQNGGAGAITTLEATSTMTTSVRCTTAAVFCGSQFGNHPHYRQHAEQLGKLLAEHQIELIYGGGNTGLMGAVANSCLENGGSVVGVIPQILVNRERAHQFLTKIHVVGDMHVRKQMMYQLSDAMIILPGGNGTLDEMFESLTWNTLDIHHKKIILLNTDHYYDALLAHYDKMIEAGFLYRTAPLNICMTPAEIIPLLTID